MDTSSSAGRAHVTKRRNEKILRPIRPNAGLECEYRRRMQALIKEMHGSVIYWLSAAYRKKPPEVIALAADRSPIADLMKMVQSLARRWRRISRLRRTRGRPQPR